MELLLVIESVHNIVAAAVTGLPVGLEYVGLPVELVVLVVVQTVPVVEKTHRMMVGVRIHSYYLFQWCN